MYNYFDHGHYFTDCIRLIKFESHDFFCDNDITMSFAYGKNMIALPEICWLL